jgi:hypothetical protein
MELVGKDAPWTKVGIATWLAAGTPFTMPTPEGDG